MDPTTSLREMVQALLREVAALRAENRELRQRLEEADETIRLLKRRLYAAKRERFVSDPPGQQSLFGQPGPEEVAESPDAHGDECDPEPPTQRERRRRSHRRLNIPMDGIPHQTVEHRLTGEERNCRCCGRERVEFGEQVSRQIEIEPARIYVREDKTYSYSCHACRSASPVEKTCTPPSALSKGIFGPSVPALVAEMKYARHLPLYRQQEMLLGPLRQWVSRPHLCYLLRRTAEGLKPLAELMRRRILSSCLLHLDETTIKMLVRGQNKAATAYLWGYHGGMDQPYVYFDFRPGRGRDGPMEILGDYRGFIVTDGYEVYHALARQSLGGLVHACCWAHVRREFVDAGAVTSDPVVTNILVLIQKLYEVEDQARDWSPEVRLALRQRESTTLVARIKVRLEEVMPALRPTSKLYQAVQYTLNRWEELGVFLTDGRVPIDNTLLERNFKAVAAGRKNYLFLGRETAGPTTAILYTLVRNAANHSLDIRCYLQDVLERVPVLVDRGLPLDELLPDRWALANPDKVLLNRDLENQKARQRKAKKRIKRRAALA
jgi:transposase